MSTPISLILHAKGRTVYHLPSTSTIAECITQMNLKQIGAIAIIDDGQMVGIFTERDILNKVYPRDLDHKKTCVSEVMTREVIYAKPDTTIEEAMATITEKRFRHLPVMEGAQLIGMVSSGDITKWIIESQQSEIASLCDYIKGVYR